MRRIPELDGLRGLAVVAILAYHLAPDAFPFGWAAVDLFFVLSGYLITAICLENLDAPGFLVNFYARRGLRIWPIYYLAVATVALMPTWDAAGLGYHLTYTQTAPGFLRDLLGNQSPLGDAGWPPMAHTWSLAVEEQFYCLWPAMLLLLGRRSAVPLAAAVVACGVAARASGFGMYQAATRGDGLAAGAVLAVVLAPKTGPRRRLAPAATAAAATSAAIVAFLMLAYPGCPLDYHYRHPGLEVPAAVLASFAAVAAAACLSGSRPLSPLRSIALTRAGTISYGLYLYHFPIYGLLDILGVRWPGVPTWPLKVGATLAAAIVSWHLVERPILRLKDRFDYRRGDGKRPNQVALLPHQKPS